MKPRVHLKCPANAYAAPNERIIEFGSDGGGGLISFWSSTDKKGKPRLDVHVYNYDRTVHVIVGRKER